MSGQPPVFAVGDRVRVVGHYEWLRRDVHGHVGTVVHVWGGDPAPAEGPWPLYDVDLPGWDAPAPLAAGEIERVAAGDRP